MHMGKLPTTQNLADWNFSQKGNYQPNDRSHQQDPEYILITSVPYFLIEKNAKYIFGAGAHKFWLMGIFPKKENYHQTIDHINRTLNIFELHQYLISLLRKTQNTFLEPALTIFG